MKLALGFVLAIGMTAPSLAKTADVWESYCISTKEAVGEQVIKMDVALDKKKWNEYLAQQGSKGWEPVQFLYGRALCRIGSEGISVEGLSDKERHQVLSRGWGRLEKRRVRLFPPRDDEELEICWSILCQAYHSILSAPVDSPTAPRASVDDLPEVSRTSLC